MQTQLLGLGGVVDAGLLRRLKEKEQPADYQALQARVIQLEGQVCPHVVTRRMWGVMGGALLLYFLFLFLFFFIFKVYRVIIQVKTLQLERDQSQMILESMQQRHKKDMELLENAHK